MQILLGSEELTNIRFPNLGIEFRNVSTGIDVFGYHIAFYGIIIDWECYLVYLLQNGWQKDRTRY